MPSTPSAAFLIKAYHPHLGSLYDASHTFHVEQVVERLRMHLVDFQIGVPEVAESDDGAILLIDEELGAVVARVSMLEPGSEGLAAPATAMSPAGLLRLIRNAIG